MSKKQSLRDIDRIIHIGDWVKFIHNYGMDDHKLIAFLLENRVITEDEVDKLKAYVVGCYCI
jgi:phage antirepressor YoqD-like protein